MKAKGRHPSNKLTPLKVKQESNPGFYADGNGLYLKVDKSGAKRWIQRIVINGKRTDMGLGSAHQGNLKKARAQAQKNKDLAQDGGDPLAEKRKLKQKQDIPTFKEASYSVHALHLPTWKNKKHAQQWINTLETYAFPVIGDKKINEVNKSDITEILNPIWNTKRETATRVKQRMNAVLEQSIAKEHRKDNPVDDLNTVFHNKQRPKVKHHKSLPYSEVTHAIKTIQSSNAMPITKLAFEFLVLNASRSGDVRNATWDEIHGDRWEIPAERMKTEKAHRIPLSKRSLEILTIAETMKDGSELIFPNNGKPLSDVALSKLMRENLIQAVPHGFRSSFKNWAEEKTNYSWQLSEFALAHVVGDESERAYARTDLFDKRRHMMESWAQYINKESADVIPIINKA